MRSCFPAQSGIARAIKTASLACAIALLTACGPTYSNHGYIPPPEDLEQIVVGVDTRSTVEETLGTASASAVRDDDALYFVRSRVKTLAMLEPEVVERDVVAVSFDGNGVVANVETFGLERGQAVRLTRRVTDSSVASSPLLGQLLGNIGSFRPGGFGDG